MANQHVGIVFLHKRDQSACLHDGLDKIRERLGLECANELIVEAPFDYQSSTMIYMPRDIPDPGNPSYQQEMEKALTGLCTATRGRPLVLFTSHAALRATQAAIQAPLEEQGILVLGHGVDGSPKHLQAVLKDNPQVVQVIKL